MISGPLGVGKTSVSGALSKVLEHTAQVVGDDLYTKSNLDKGLDVVVDFVVEDELPWLREQLSGYDLQLRYVVLMADKETLIERLKKRNELRYKDRSMILLDQLSNEPSNKNYLLDTSDKEISEIVQEIINSPRFIVN